MRGEEKFWNCSLKKKIHKICVAFITAAKIKCLVVALRLSCAWGFLCSRSFHVFYGWHYNCTAHMLSLCCLFKSYCVQPSRIISIHLSVVLDLWLKVIRWLVVHFHAGGKIISAWSPRQKYGQHNRISSLVSAILPCRDIPIGMCFCCTNQA